MEPEIELELFAALCADVEAGRPLADVLRAEGLPESTWHHSRDVWMGRMSTGPEADRKALEDRYQTAFHARKRVARGHVATAASDEPKELPAQPRTRLGTIILPSKSVQALKARPPEEPRTNDRPPPPSATPPMGVPLPKAAEAPPTPKSPAPEHTPPMGVAAPNLADIPPPKPLPSAEHTPPMGVAAPNLADIPPPRPLPSAEHTPPMGVAAPNRGETSAGKPVPNPEHTPPMGVAAPNRIDVAPRPPRRMPEPTPPMRPRSDIISDDVAKAAADAVADRKTDPPPPVPSRPALPFPHSIQTTANGPVAVPHPPASAPFRPAGSGYPAVPQGPPPAPLPPPRPFPQAPQAAPSAPTYGSYPSMMGLAGQGSVAGSAATPSSPSFASPAKAPGPPLALGGFPATASGPRLTLDVYAAFAAEIAVKPVDVAEIRERYGLTDVAHTAEDEAWQRRFSSDRETYVRYAKLFQHYRDWFSGRTPR